MSTMTTVEVLNAETLQRSTASSLPHLSNASAIDGGSVGQSLLVAGGG